MQKDITTQIRYRRELALLPDALQSGRDSISTVEAAVKSIGTRPVKYVGSGGALIVAQLGRDLHQFATRTFATATTPLLANQEPPSPDSAFVLVSSSGRNPDASIALAAARAAEYDPVIMITRRLFSELPARIQRFDPHVATIDSPPDGFLATGSIAAASVALVGAYGFTPPATSEVLKHSEFASPLTDRLLVLYGWGFECVARDIETRLSELGIASVQLADFRNFAHGRHVGFWRNINSTTILALVDEKSEPIASRTLDLLPPDTNVTILSSDLRWPSSAIELLTRSMRLPLALEHHDPGNPRVPQFGRKLYNLPISRILARDRTTPVDRKQAAGGYLHDRDTVEQAFKRWLLQLSSTGLTGLVLDYDGTCCTTEGRFAPPSTDVQQGILRALELGLELGFASGRGKSLSNILRSWIPESHWSRVLLGLYNGSLHITLDQEVPDQTSIPGALADLALELQASIGSIVSVEARRTQLTLQSTTSLDRSPLLSHVQAILARHGALFKAFTSAHSLDIISQVHSKSSVIESIARRGGSRSTILAVGDRGAPGGNDFELLASTPLSLSVDQVSPDLSHCWNLDTSGKSGPALLAQYLRSLRPTADTVHYTVRRPR